MSEEKDVTKETTTTTHEVKRPDEPAPKPVEPDGNRAVPPGSKPTTDTETTKNIGTRKK